MKTLLPILLLLFGLTANAQQLTEDRPVTIQAGECLTKTTRIRSEGDKCLKEFVVDVPQDGNYYADALLLPHGTTDYTVSIDGKTVIGSIKNLTKNWQFVSLQDEKLLPKTIQLTKGQHTLAFSSPKPFVPVVDVVALSRNGVGTVLKRSSTTDYLAKLGLTKLPDNYAATKKSGKSGGRILSNPEGQYLHEIDYGYNATTTVEYWLDAGLPYTFKTGESNTDPVLYVFYSDNPGQGSWSDDDGAGNLNPQVSFTPAISGFYRVVLKTFGSAPGGIANFYFNGSQTMQNIPVSGNWYAIQPKNGEVNFFTSHISGATNLLVA